MVTYWFLNPILFKFEIKRVTHMSLLHDTWAQKHEHFLIFLD